MYVQSKPSLQQYSLCLVLQPVVTLNSAIHSVVQVAAF